MGINLIIFQGIIKSLLCGRTDTGFTDKFSTKYESVIIFGRATEIFDNEKFIYQS